VIWQLYHIKMTTKRT